jgi:hypothetical protein
VDGRRCLVDELRAVAWISLVPIFSAVGAACWRVFNASLVAMSSLFAALGAKSGASIASSAQMPLRIPLNKEKKNVRIEHQW